MIQLHFNNLSQEDNRDVNEFLKLAELYFDKNKDEIVFQKFLSIFNQLCNEKINHIPVIEHDNISDKLLNLSAS